MNIKVVTHYSKNDSECRGDYYLVTIEKNGKVIQSYGDYYHDKGHLKAEAFLDAMDADDDVQHVYVGLA